MSIGIGTNIILEYRFIIGIGTIIS